jgi:hypothetical protein
MKIIPTLVPAGITGVLVAGALVVPAADAAPAAASARHVAVKSCHYAGPSHTTLKIMLRLPHRAADRNDLHAVRVRATDKHGRGDFRNHRVRTGSVLISVEHRVESSGGGQISSASAVRRHGSPAVWRLNPRGSGANVERVAAQVTFLLRNGTRVKATCAATLD